MGIIVANSQQPETPFCFAHELVRQTLLAGISAPRKQHLHAGVADAIEGLYRSDVKERAGEIAEHLLKAESFVDGQRLVRYLKALPTDWSHLTVRAGAKVHQWSQ
jgi:hypothetical protein